MRMVSRNGPLERKVYTMEGGREVGLLDVVRAQAAGPQPVNHQPENYLAAGPRPGILGAGLDAVLGYKRWKPAGQVEPANAPPVLEPLVSKGPDLFGSRRDREDLSSSSARQCHTRTWYGDLGCSRSFSSREVGRIRKTAYDARLV